MFIHIDDEHAGFLALLVDGIEIGFVDQAGNGLVGHERTRGQRADGRQVHAGGIALVRDKEAAFVYDQRGGRISTGDELAESFVQ